MPDRTRPIRKEICVNKQELNLIQHKMRQLGTHNFGVYARKMLIDGYIIKVDYTEQKKLAAAVSRISTNINLVCRRINSTGRCYSNIGISKIDSMLRTPNCPFVLFVGTKKLVKRKEFEQFISEKLVI